MDINSTWSQHLINQIASYCLDYCRNTEQDTLKLVINISAIKNDVRLIKETRLHCELDNDI